MSQEKVALAGSTIRSQFSTELREVSTKKKERKKENEQSDLKAEGDQFVKSAGESERWMR